MYGKRNHPRPPYISVGHSYQMTSFVYLYTKAVSESTGCGLILRMILWELAVDAAKYSV